MGAAQVRSITAFGASSAIAQACLRAWCSEPTSFVLVGRSGERLEAIAADLRVRCPDGAARVLTGAFSGAAEIARTVGEALGDGAPEIAMVAFGSLPDQAALAGDPQAFHDALAVNGVMAGLCAQLVFERMLAQGRGTLVLIGSVAGDRGRRSNYAYGAAKAMLATLAEGMRHAAAGTGVSVVLVKPGPTDTPMTRAAGTRGRLAPPEAVARAIVAGVQARRPVVYAPPAWRLIMAVIRALPRPLFDRLNV